MFATKKYSYSSLLEYYPVRYNVSDELAHDRKEVYDFKEGHASQRVKDLLVERINKITAGEKGKWLICFIPSSKQATTVLRYGKLSKYLSAHTSVMASNTAISNKEDREAQHTGARLSDPSATFAFSRSEIAGKKILLIDDVITNGSSFRKCAEHLKASGAADVQGLFVARTMHPGLTTYTRNMFLTFLF